MVKNRKGNKGEQEKVKNARWIYQDGMKALKIGCGENQKQK